MIDLRLKVLRVLEMLAALLPYVLGVVFIWFPIRRVYFDPFLERALYYLLLFGTWEIFLQAMFKWYVPRRASLQKSAPRMSMPARARLKELALFFILVTSALGTLLFLQFFRARLSEEQLYLALFTLGMVALQRSLRARSKFLPAFFARFFGVLGLGYLSFMIVDPIWKWQPLLPCAGVGFLFMSRDLAHFIDEHPALSPTRFRLATRALLLCIVLAPTLGTALCYFGKLSSNFVFLFAVCPLLLPLAEKLRLADIGGGERPAVLTRCRVIFVAYTAIVLAVGLYGRLS